ncbi:hypothetical protein Q4R62_15260, partial [Morganella morganii]
LTESTFSHGTILDDLSYLGQPHKEYTVSEMIVPFESLTVPVTTIHSNDEITISYISDFGGIISKPVVFDK